jgi:hypothetical protein
MSFKDIAEIIKKYTGENSESGDKSQKSKDSRAFELFLQGKQSVEVAIELELSADEVEELHVQYWSALPVVDPDLPLADGGGSPTEPTEITNFGSPSPDSDTITMPSDASIPSFSPQLKSYVKDRHISTRMMRRLKRSILVTSMGMCNIFP